MGNPHTAYRVAVGWSSLNISDINVPHITRDSLPYKSACVIDELVSSNE